MVQKINQLSDRKVANEKKRGLHADGGGLYLQISAAGAKSWIFRYTGLKYEKDGSPKLDGYGNHKRGLKDMGLGSVSTFSLKDAREKALECRKMVADGIDPIEHRKAERGKALAEVITVMTFKACASSFMSAHSVGWKNVKHVKQWASTLETYVYPVFGDLPVQSVDTGLILKAVEPIWTTKTETAGRVRGRIEAVLDWAAARKYRGNENPARWKGHLDKLLPARSKVAKIKHHAALPYDDMGEFMVELRRHKGIAAKGLELLILTAARTGEVIRAEWSEIDTDKALWTISGERMKAGKEHRVPLSEPALAALTELKGVALNEFVLPGMRQGTSLSNMAFLQLLKRMGRDDLTAHGFRSTFRDWAAERTNYSQEVAEMALAHTISDKVEAAYRRGDLFEKRQWIMRDWAEFCSNVEKKGGEVVHLLGERGA